MTTFIITLRMTVHNGEDDIIEVDQELSEEMAPILMQFSQDAQPLLNSKLRLAQAAIVEKSGM